MIADTQTFQEELREIETAAVALAWGAGKILSEQFGKQLSIEYKDKNQLDPVTSADKATQEYLVNEITRLFPEHGILGEEGSDETDPTGPAPDFLWVLDPLDGTTNFLNGLPVYASSIGILHRGRPVAGALYIPWPSPGGGFVLHCRQGGGSRFTLSEGGPDESVAVYASDKPVGNRLIGLPGFFVQTTKFGKPVGRNPGELRTTGSIAYELAMTACGVLQYAIIGAPRMWDMLAGVIAVQEAGGTVMTRLKGEKRWRPMDSLVPSWEQTPPTLKELRQWVAPLVAGNQQVAPLIAHNMQARFRPVARLRQWGRKVIRKLKDSRKSGG
ncbi:MAG: inositol monophosphatase [Chloroflexota bacterium]|nr:inositol monophosphatase [Chloroflexota bacterium]